jgi:outer membrane protein assembly factor BamD (BamD/ComL family)
MKLMACAWMVLAGFSGVAAGQTSYRLEPGQGVRPVLDETARPEGTVLAQTRRLIAEEKFREAHDLIDRWIRDNEDTDSPAMPEAYLLRGTALVGRDQEFKALFDFEHVAQNYPHSEAFPVALERELEVGNRYLQGLRRRQFGFRIESAVDVAEEIIVRINERLPGSRLAEKGLLDLADYYYRERDLKMAATAYECFVLLFPASDQRQKAMERRIYATIAQFKGPSYDASGLIEARYQIEEFQERYPREAAASGLSDALSARLDESAAAQVLTVARWYLKRGDPASARLTLTRLVQRHPATAAAAEGYGILKERGWIRGAGSATVRQSDSATEGESGRAKERESDSATESVSDQVRPGVGDGGRE